MEACDSPTTFLEGFPCFSSLPSHQRKDIISLRFLESRHRYSYSFIHEFIYSFVRLCVHSLNKTYWVPVVLDTKEMVLKRAELFLFSWNLQSWNRHSINKHADIKLIQLQAERKIGYYERAIGILHDLDWGLTEIGDFVETVALNTLTLVFNSPVRWLLSQSLYRQENRLREIGWLAYHCTVRKFGAGCALSSALHCTTQTQKVIIYPPFTCAHNLTLPTWKDSPSIFLLDSYSAFRIYWGPTPSTKSPFYLRLPFISFLLDSATIILHYSYGTRPRDPCRVNSLRHACPGALAHRPESSPKPWELDKPIFLSQFYCVT